MIKYRKDKIIILCPRKFKKFDLDRYEIKYFKKKFSVEIHDFSKLLYPKFNLSFKKNYANDKAIKKFKSFKKWRRYINRLKNLNNNANIIEIKY